MENIFEVEFEGKTYIFNHPTFEQFYNAFKASFSFDKTFDTDIFSANLLPNLTTTQLSEEEIFYLGTSLASDIYNLFDFNVLVKEDKDLLTYTSSKNELFKIEVKKPDFTAVKLIKQTVANSDNDTVMDIMHKVLFSFTNLTNSNVLSMSEPVFMFSCVLNYIKHLQIKQAVIKKK